MARHAVGRRALGSVGYHGDRAPLHQIIACFEGIIHIGADGLEWIVRCYGCCW